MTGPDRRNVTSRVFLAIAIILVLVAEFRAESAKQEAREAVAIAREAELAARKSEDTAKLAVAAARGVPAEPRGLIAARPIMLKGPIAEIIDGDTVTLRMGSYEYRIRLHRIDCPESDQPFGDKAAETLGHLVDSDEVECRLVDADRYGRLVGVLSVDGKSINQELVEAGMARWYQEYAPGDQQLAEAQEKANSAGRGLWADQNGVAPWEWGKRK